MARKAPAPMDPNHNHRADEPETGFERVLAAKRRDWAEVLRNEGSALDPGDIHLCLCRECGVLFGGIERARRGGGVEWVDWRWAVAS